MKRNLALIGILGVLVAQPAYAETIQGMITYLDSANKMVAIRQTPFSGRDSESRVLLTDSVKGLALGKFVHADVQKTKDSQLLKTESIEIGLGKN